jgi:hypothetical protein
MRVGVSRIFISLCLNLFFYNFQLTDSTKEWTPDVEDLLHVKWTEEAQTKYFEAAELIRRRFCRANGFCSVVFVPAPPSPGPVIQPFPFLLKQSAIYKQTNFMKSVTYLLSAMKTSNTSPNAWALSKDTVYALRNLNYLNQLYHIWSL